MLKGGSEASLDFSLWEANSPPVTIAVRALLGRYLLNIKAKTGNIWKIYQEQGALCPSQISIQGGLLQRLYWRTEEWRTVNERYPAPRNSWLFLQEHRGIEKLCDITCDFVFERVGTWNSAHVPLQLQKCSGNVLVRFPLRYENLSSKCCINNVTLKIAYQHFYKAIDIYNNY